jgi:hypothetical protein
MQIFLNKSPGLRNDLLISIPRPEIRQALLNIANRGKLMQLPGLLRHLEQQDAEGRRRVNDCKVPVEEHIGLLNRLGNDLFDTEGKPKRRMLVIGCRNVGNNHGFVAWQRHETPQFFHIQGDPLNQPAYSCLMQGMDGSFAIRRLRFERDRVLEGSRDITGDVDWCVYGNPVLRGGQIVPIEEVIDQYYDIRHVLAFDRHSPKGRQIGEKIYESYPERFRENALKALTKKGVPRNRFLQNALGLCEENLYILQREGTIEEIGYCLKEAGAKDGIILDNGGSVFCWTWWVYPKGGYIFTAPDFRSPSSAVIAFVLKGQAAIDLPGGSVSFGII